MLVLVDRQFNPLPIPLFAKYTCQIFHLYSIFVTHYLANVLPDELPGRI